ncbi:MAG: 23S rRNA pseudouridine(1911/1915/1917) synthase RluD [Candidatus Dasytiphilus stammeri]
MTSKIRLTATISHLQNGQRLDKALVTLFPEYSRSCIKKWILRRYVVVNHIVFDKPKIRVLKGAKISINIDDNTLLEAQNIALNIIYEDEYLIVINKPPNLVVHPGAGNLNGTLLNALLYHYPNLANVPRAGIIHRLDKDTTGLMIIAKNVLIQKRLIEAMQCRTIIREYEAVVIGAMKSGGCISKPISRHPKKRTIMAIHPGGKMAITHYRIIEMFRAYTHLGLRLETGRTHQIRVHMAYINHPLVGDPIYKGKVSNKLPSLEVPGCLYQFNRQALHASMLRFYHPHFGIEMELHAPLPLDMLNLINLLKEQIR